MVENPVETMKRKKAQQMKDQLRYRNACFAAWSIELDWFHDWTKDENSIVKYIILQGELSKEGKKHVQVYVEFIGQKSLNQIQKFFGDKTLHVDARRAKTPEQARVYCTPDKKPEHNHGIYRAFEEYGKMSQQGRSTTLVGLRDRLLSGETLKDVIKTTTNEAELTACLKYERCLTALEHDVYEKRIKAEILEEEFKGEWRKPWQTDLLNELEQPVDRRDVIWYYDEVGNTGKSEVSRFLGCTKSIYQITGGKQADILYGYNNQNIVIYDLPRTYVDNMSHIYNTVENFKNGYFLSTKYESRQRIFKRPHIVVMANFLPDVNGVSKDRWDIRNITGSTVTKMDISDVQRKHETQRQNAIKTRPLVVHTEPIYAFEI